MSKLIGLAGAHGTGKSTIINELTNRWAQLNDATWKVDKSQLSRSVQEKMGLTSLADALKSEDTIWELQHGILSAMEERDATSPYLTVVDRTPADVFAYTMCWVDAVNHGPFSISTLAKVFTFKDRCIKMLSSYGMIIHVPIVSEIPFVPEAGRAGLDSISKVDADIDSFLFQSSNVHVHHLSSIKRENRLNEVLAVINLVEATQMEKQYGG